MTNEQIDRGIKYARNRHKNMCKFGFGEPETLSYIIDVLTAMKGPEEENEN